MFELKLIQEYPFASMGASHSFRRVLGRWFDSIRHYSMQWQPNAVRNIVNICSNDGKGKRKELIFVEHLPAMKLESRELPFRCGGVINEIAKN